MSDQDDVFAGKFPNGFSIRDEANAIVVLAFRNRPLEDLHAGKHSSLQDDPSTLRYGFDRG